MREFEGDLLIGGITLRHIHGELEVEQPTRGSRDWQLSGRMNIEPQELTLLELGRPYRLELEDGHAGQVVVSHIDGVGAKQALVEFQSRTTPQPR
jgi:hypothetical protein